MFRSTRGFSLIELLVVITIMGFLVGGAIAGYLTFNERQILIQGGKTLISELRKAQAKATAGVTVDGCTGLQGYRVSNSAGANTFTVTPVCASGSPTGTTVLLPSGTQLMDAYSVTFATYTGTANVTTQQLRLEDTAGEQNYLIEIGATGLIADLGVTAAPTPTPSPQDYLAAAGNQLYGVLSLTATQADAETTSSCNGRAVYEYRQSSTTRYEINKVCGASRTKKTYALESGVKFVSGSQTINFFNTGKLTPNKTILIRYGNDSTTYAVTTDATGNLVNTGTQ